MPLIVCPDCGHQVSDAAPTCPGCGRPIATPSPPQQTGPVVVKPTIWQNPNAGCAGCAIIILGIALAMVLGWCR